VGLLIRFCSYSCWSLVYELAGNYLPTNITVAGVGDPIPIVRVQDEKTGPEEAVCLPGANLWGDALCTEAVPGM
jgi:hypothetical protein